MHCIEYKLEAENCKPEVVQLFTFHLAKHPTTMIKNGGRGWWSKDEPIAGVFLWTITLGHTTVHRLTKNYASALCGKIWIDLIWFHGISTIVSYLTLNLFLYAYTALFQTIQLSVSTVFIYTRLNVKQFYFNQYNLACVHILNIKYFYFKQFGLS